MSAQTFRVRDPNYLERIKAVFARQGFLHYIGAWIEEVAPGRCVIAAKLRDELSQQNGFFHGGLMGTIADAAGASATSTLIEADQSLLTVEYKINFLAPAKGHLLKAIGEVVRAGRTLTVCQVTLLTVDDAGKEQQCGLATVTMMTLTSRGDRK
jgi:uncharacterized protein (TIGR00369 family)